MNRKRFYTPARQRFLISILMDNEEKSFCSRVWADIPVGIIRVSSWARPMLEPLREKGMIQWDYAKCYTVKNLFDVKLTEKGYHKAAQCLLYKHRDSFYGAFRRGHFVNKRKHPG